MEESLRKIHLIIFLDSLSFGLIFVFIKSNFLHIGGSHLHIGLYAICVLLTEFIASDVRTKLLAAYGTKNSLIISLAIGVVSNVTISAAETAWLIILMRCLFVATNHTGTTLRESVLRSIPDGLHQGFTSKQAQLELAGLLLGPVIAGYLSPDGFSYICLFASLLTFINWCLVQSIPVKEVPVADDQPLSDKALKGFETLSYDLENSDWKEHWDLLASKYLLEASTLTFFTKFNVVMLHNYRSSMLVIGCTTSLIAALRLVTRRVVEDLKTKYSSSTMEFLWYSLAASAPMLLFACYSPELSGFLSALVPVIALNWYVSSTWRELFAARGNAHLDRLQDTVGTAANLTVPILIGATCDCAGRNAVIFFSVVPVMAAMYIFGTYTSQRDDESGKNKND